jgi:hypothetical protein
MRQANFLFYMYIICSFCEAIAGSLSTVTTAVSMSKVALINCGEVGSSAAMLSDYIRCRGVPNLPFLHRLPRGNK